MKPRRHGTRSGSRALRRLEKFFRTRRANMSALHPGGLIEEVFGGNQRKLPRRVSPNRARMGGRYSTISLGACQLYCPHDKRSDQQQGALISADFLGAIATKWVCEGSLIGWSAIYGSAPNV